MTDLPRRTFLKRLFAGCAAVTSWKFFGVPARVTLSVDKEGNATLLGAELTVDDRAKATIK